MMFQARIAVGDPRRTAQALAALWGDAAVALPSATDGEWLAAAGDKPGSPIAFVRRSNEPERVSHLMIATPHCVERVIEIACTQGFHAEEMRGGMTPVIEFWIDEHFLLEVVPPTGQAMQTFLPERTLQPLAA